jgi:hypothetical protein
MGMDSQYIGLTRTPTLFADLPKSALLPLKLAIFPLTPAPSYLCLPIISGESKTLGSWPALTQVELARSFANCEDQISTSQLRTIFSPSTSLNPPSYYRNDTRNVPNRRTIKSRRRCQCSRSVYFLPHPAELVLSSHSLRFFNVHAPEAVILTTTPHRRELTAHRTILFRPDRLLHQGN